MFFTRNEILLFVFSFFLFIKASGQNICVDSSFTNSYYLQNQQFYGYNRIATNDNGTLILAAAQNNILYKEGIVKLDKNGLIEWSRIFTPNASNETFHIQKICQLQDGNFIIGGIINYTNLAFPAFAVLVKINLLGNITWQKKYKNNYGSSATDDVWVRNIQEGLNADIILMLEENQKQSITRVNSNGVTLWSDMYLQNFFFIQNSTGLVDANNVLNFWGTSYRANTCFTYNESLTNVQLDYNTGGLSSAKSFCIQPGKTPVRLDPVSGGGRNGTIKLNNGNTVVFIKNDESGYSVLVNLFDANANFLRCKLFTPINSVSSGTVPIYSYDANKINGEIIFNFHLVQIAAPSAISPFNFFVFLDENLALKKEFFIQNTPADTIIGQAKFLPNGQMNFVAGSRQLNNSQYYQVNYTNIISGGDASAFCNAKDSLYGNFEPHGLVFAGSDFTFDSTRQNVYAYDGNINMAVSSFNLFTDNTCKKVSICDTLKINGPTTVCLSNDTISYTAYKNPQCLKKITWVTDSTIAKIVYVGLDSTSIIFRQSGTTTLFASIDGCVLKDSLVINIPAPKILFKINRDSLICPGKNLVLKASPGFAQYQWQDGSTADSLLIIQPGFYRVSAIDSCGNIFKDSIQVKNTVTDFAFPAKETICLTDTFSFLLPNNLHAITWDPFTSGLVQQNRLKLFPLHNENYTIRFNLVPDCIIEKSLNVLIEKCPDVIYFPNSFTPNQDGLNDIFKPFVTGSIQNYNLKIFNRFGQKIFESNYPKHGWDGNYKNLLQDQNVYIWQCNYKFSSKSMQFQKGSILLIH